MGSMPQTKEDAAMWRLKVFVLAGLLLLSGSLAAEETPRAIIERAVKAMGGEEALSGGSARVIKIKGILCGYMVALPLDGRLSSQPDSNVRLELTAEILQKKETFIVTSNAKEGWVFCEGDWRKMNETEIA